MMLAYVRQFYVHLLSSVDDGEIAHEYKGHYRPLTFWHQSFTFNSNKSPTWCNSFSVYYPDVSLQLSMFQAFSGPSSGAQWLQWQPLVLPTYHGDSRAVFVVWLAGPTTNTAWLSPRYKGKARGCHRSHWAPDVGRENARNMLSCKQTSG